MYGKMYLWVGVRKRSQLVNFKTLRNDPVHRNVAEVIKTGNDTITVFEPSIDDVNEMVEVIPIFNESVRESGELDISGSLIMRKLVPMLTDLQGMEDLSDDEIDDIVNNPTVALMQLNHVLENIIVGVYKTVILSYKSKLEMNDFEVASQEVGNQGLVDMVRAAVKNPETQEQLKDVYKANDQLDKLLTEDETESAKQGLDADKITDNTPTTSFQERMALEAKAHFQDSFSDDIDLNGTIESDDVK